ncbi:hypothetical protein SAMN04487764_3092 [Gillisia sp. Hel1_33_143]|uniref:hypothetical protein n=1 Tax=Gillisia sp. Hel1_33_143 TaxID=1336796 RepID=UPI00087A6C49|nr:hypothetical protein [Gillisia sp. Hel1_33_143]SDS80035.1 hypothetical protein SAMN04487764_3092 [Gillisia sp. Hel1_33_143]
MRPFLINLFFFILFGLVAYIIAVLLFGDILMRRTNANIMYEPESGFNEFRFSEANKIKDLDVLFIGSSHSYRSFDPRILNEYGLKTFNLGTSSQTHIQTNYILNEYLNKLNPKLVVYEVYPVTFMSEGVESTLNLLSSRDNIDLSLVKMSLTSSNLAVYNSFINIISYKILSKAPKNEYPIEEKYISGGYVETLGTNNFDYVKDKTWSPKKGQLSAFESNLSLIKSHNIPVILVEAPYTYNFTNRTDIDRYFKDKGEFYNFNEKSVFKNKYYFKDYHHLNKRGASLLTNTIAPLLKTKIPDNKN